MKNFIINVLNMFHKQKIFYFIDNKVQHSEVQENPQAIPGETVTLITELPKAGLEVTWMKDNVPLSITDEKYETINQDTSYQLVIPDVTIEDGGDYKVQGGGFESTFPLSVQGLEQKKSL